MGRGLPGSASLAIGGVAADIAFSSADCYLTDYQNSARADECIAC